MTSVVATGLGWPECPRWHNGDLWFTDMYQAAVFRSASDGSVERVCEIDDIPGGLGWLPDGSLVIVSMRKRQLIRYDGRLHPYADLTGVHSDAANDLVVDDLGRCYVSTLGGAFEGIDGGYVPEAVPLALVTEGGSSVVPTGAAVTPNGMAILPDGRFFVAEPLSGSVKVFTIAGDGTLHDGRRFAALVDRTAMPDGIAVDSEGCVFIASPPTHEVVRVRDGGDVVSRLTWPEDQPSPVACTLGGDSGDQLYICFGDVGPALHGPPAVPSGPLKGRIEVSTVAAKRGGLP